jgi:hypothetical protein
MRSQSCGQNFAEGGQQAVHFFHCVVVEQSNAQEAAIFFDIELLSEIQCVVVAIPGEQSAIPELGGELKRCVSGCA